jgi:hypothetical protein
VNTKQTVKVLIPVLFLSEVPIPWPENCVLVPYVFPSPLRSRHLYMEKELLSTAEKLPTHRGPVLRKRVSTGT